jgi:hypothetical protein
VTVKAPRALWQSNAEIALDATAAFQLNTTKLPAKLTHLVAQLSMTFVPECTSQRQAQPPYLPLPSESMAAAPVLQLRKASL